MTDTCVFCGSPGSLTREHVFPNWLSGIGLSAEEVTTRAGALNELGRAMGPTPPFTLTVREVCATCNNGWMHDLETTAKRVLSPLILGDMSEVGRADQASVAAWAQKTALIAMLVSSKEERERGHGLSPHEYRAFYGAGKRGRPLPASTTWLGRYPGDRHLSGARVVPVALEISGLPASPEPHGYLYTVVVGSLIVHGLRFTSESLAVPVEGSDRLTKLSPSEFAATRFPVEAVTDEDFLALENGSEIRSADLELQIVPWRPAVDLAQSRDTGRTVELPAICGKHVVHYPKSLVRRAAVGRFYYFMTACECGTTYLVRTQTDGAHFKAADSFDAIALMYEDLPGEEFAVSDAGGTFVCKDAR